jgi:hypothetical protein
LIFTFGRNNNITFYRNRITHYIKYKHIWFDFNLKSLLNYYFCYTFSKSIIFAILFLKVYLISPNSSPSRLTRFVIITTIG